MLTGLDRLIGWISPAAGLARARARAAMSVIAARGYDAASVSRRTSGWRTTKGDANAEVGGALDRVRERHRDLVRNNAWAARAVQAIVNNTVGSGITGLPVSPSGQRARRLQRAYDTWARSTDCDAAGRLNLDGLQALALRMVVESGECLIRRRVIPRGPDRIPLALQLLEGDHLDLLKNDTLDNGGSITHGVERDSVGAVVAYWLFPQHPGDALQPRRLLSERVDASEVIHVFRTDRPGQVRGMPWGAAGMVRLYDLDGYEDAVLLRQKLSACFTAFVHDIEAGDPNASPAGSTTGKPVETIEPGMVEYLPPGKEVTFANPPSAGDAGPFVRDQLRAVAAAYGVPYETLTGDLTGVNYSSGRLGWLEFHRNIEAWRWQMLIPQMLDPIGRWFLDMARVTFGQGIEAGARFDWTPPHRQMVDPTKEVPALVDAVRGGLTSLQAVHRELGLDTEQVLAEMAADAQALDAAGLVVEADGRKPKNGAAMPAPAPAPADDSDAERATAAVLDRLAAVSERQADLFASAKPPAVTLNPQFHVTVDAAKRGAVVREVLELDEDGIPTKVVERPIPDTGGGE